MHLHLPKPLHGWRAFTGEVGVIVLGVLIALGAQQLVEDLHQRSELRDAEAAMTSEIRDDDLPQAFTRAAIHQCYADQLDAIEAAVVSGADRAKVLALAKAYRPAVRTWDDQAWQAALASQVLSNSGSKRMLGWASAYVLIPRLAEGAKQELDELPLLRANMSGTGPLSPAQQDRLLQVISVLRDRNGMMNAASLVFIRFAADEGLALSPERKAALLSEARRQYGACASEPTPGRLNLRTQFTFTGAGAEPRH
jgi:hypothetical protein